MWAVDGGGLTGGVGVWGARWAVCWSPWLCRSLDPVVEVGLGHCVGAGDVARRLGASGLAAVVVSNCLVAVSTAGAGADVGHLLDVGQATLPVLVTRKSEPMTLPTAC